MHHRHRRDKYNHAFMKCIYSMQFTLAARPQSKTASYNLWPWFLPQRYASGSWSQRPPDGCGHKQAHSRTLLWTRTWGELTSQNLWSRLHSHFVGITWHNIWSQLVKICHVIQSKFNQLGEENADKVCLSDIGVTNISKSFTHKMSAELNQLALIWNKITSQSPYVYV